LAAAAEPLPPTLSGTGERFNASAGGTALWAYGHRGGTRKPRNRGGGSAIPVRARQGEPVIHT